MRDEWHGEQDQDEPQTVPQEQRNAEFEKNLKSAIDDFEMSHWNRRIAREDFDNRVDLAFTKQFYNVRNRRLDPTSDADAW